MTPEEFYHLNKLTNRQYMRDIRIKSLSWVLECFEKGTIRKRTIVNLIPKSDLISLMKELEEEEKYEICATIKKILDTIYTPKLKPNTLMSEAKRLEIIQNLEETLKKEYQKIGGGNVEIITSLTKKLEQLKGK